MNSVLERELLPPRQELAAGQGHVLQTPLACFNAVSTIALFFKVLFKMT